MSESRCFQKLKEHILNLSAAEDFNVAKLEWHLDHIRVTEEFGRCPCGQKIKEHCYLNNIENGNTTWVGNVCVRRFMGIDSGTLFDGLRRVRANISARPNSMLIEYAWNQGYLYSQNEYDFLRNITKIRRLSEKQTHWLQKINRRILQSIVVRQVSDQVPISDGSGGSDLEEEEN